MMMEEHIDGLLTRSYEWLTNHAGWEYGFSVEEMEKLRKDLAEAIGVEYRPLG